MIRVLGRFSLPILSRHHAVNALISCLFVALFASVRALSSEHSLAQPYCDMLNRQYLITSSDLPKVLHEHLPGVHIESLGTTWYYKNSLYRVRQPDTQQEDRLAKLYSMREVYENDKRAWQFFAGIQEETGLRVVASEWQDDAMLQLRSVIEGDSLTMVLGDFSQGARQRLVMILYGDLMLRLKQLIGSLPNNGEPVVRDATILSEPRIRIEKLNGQVVVDGSPLKLDLHPDNILVGRDDRLYLIDPQ